tara:strand:- start:907 stop:1707 length:801 start_codon:yes stop_codon:yes gene_type:complete
MKYILGLAFLFEYYKRPATLRIFVDDMLIDELSLTESIGRIGDEVEVEEWFSKFDRKNFQYIRDHHPKEYARVTKNNWHYWTNFPVVDKVFLFEIDQPLPDKKIRIEVINDNTNYNNGFMTKNSFVVVEQVFLIPKKYFMDLDLLAEDCPDLQRWDNDEPYSSNMLLAEGDNTPYNWHWPAHFNEFDVENNRWVPGLRGITKGGSWEHSFDLADYKGMTVIKPRNSTAQLLEQCYWIMDPIFLTYHVRGNLINKFNEDQRSNNTKD